MESESVTTETKISDSGYSNSCSNSNTNSQRSASSKSRNSDTNSSRSSGYCGGANNPPDGSIVDPNQQNHNKRNKDNTKKKLKYLTNTETVIPCTNVASPADTARTTLTVIKEPMGAAVLPTPTKDTTPSTPSVPTFVVPTAVSLPDQPVMEESPTQKEELPVWNESNESEEQVALKPEIEQEVPVDEPAEPQAEVTKEDGFCCVISLYDGVVLYTTPSLTNVLGFPMDMWVGRSFIDFVHPKDRETFSTQVTTGIAVPLVDSPEKVKDVKSYLHVCLRKYRGLRSTGYGVLEKAVAYQAFHLTVSIKQLPNVSVEDVMTNGLFLVVAAVPVYTTYKVPEEKRRSPKFGMRHTASCMFSHVDPDVVTNFGFLPQDMLGKSVFDFYHPEDMPFLKEAYKSVLKRCQIAGAVYRSKPYRFAVQNGGFAMIETEWSSFVNPWSRRVEFVIGLHRVLKGPLNPDVFATNQGDNYKDVSEETLKECKVIQGEILLLLGQELPRTLEASKYNVSKRCKDLANFMESIMGEASKSKLEIEFHQESEPAISARDSVMLGEISPHHDYYDSKSSSDTPPSYNQLNYNENLKRFFQSKPKTRVSDESNGPNNVETDQQCLNNQKCLSPVQNSGASASESGGNLSSESNPNLENTTTSGTNTSNDSYKSPLLTESRLTRHNEDMEKNLIKRHKEQRTFIREREHKKSHKKYGRNCGDGVNRQFRVEHGHGVKRSGSRSSDEDQHKYTKHKPQNGGLMNQKQYVAGNVNANAFKASGRSQHQSTSNNNNYCPGLNNQPRLNDVNLWPPFSVTLAPMNNSQTYSTTGQTIPGAGNFAGNMFPVYYIPTTSVPPGYVDNPLVAAAPRYQIQYLPAYNPNLPAAPLLCPPLPVLPVPITSPVPTLSTLFTTENRDMNNANSNAHPMLGNILSSSEPRARNIGIPPSVGPTLTFPRPQSQATSVKAEPGSALGSIASASFANKVAQNINQSKQPMSNSNNYCNNIDEKSSCYSSSYSSFFKTTDTGSGSGEDFSCFNKMNQTEDEIEMSQPLPSQQRKKDPPWVESVATSSDLIYRYQMAVNNIEDILKADLKTLRDFEQPSMVNDQLNQLYIEMELEGLSKKLILEEGFTSSGSSGEDVSTPNTSKPKKKRRSFSSLMMIYEENAPFPPPPM